MGLVRDAGRRNIRNSCTELDVFIGEERLDSSQSIDFLGVRSDSCLTWADQIEKVEKETIHWALRVEKNQQN